MKESQYPAAVLTGLLIGACFWFGSAVMRSMMGDEPRAASQERLAPAEEDAALACAALHPDPEIGTALVRRIRSGRVALRVDDLEETLNGTFDARSGHPTITLSRRLLPASTDESSCEPVLATLTHEFVHYEQWLRDGETGAEWVHAKRGVLDSAQCVRFVMLEIEAYGRTCLVGERLGWRSAMAQCDVVDMAARAKSAIAFNGDAHPECLGAWKTLARGRAPAPPPRRAKPQRVRTPPPDRDGPIYMPPP